MPILLSAHKLILLIYGDNRDMLDDFHEAHFDEGRREEEPEATAKTYYNMLAVAQQPLYGHTKVSQLDAIARLMAVKS